MVRWKFVLANPRGFCAGVERRLRSSSVCARAVRRRRFTGDTRSCTQVRGWMALRAKGAVFVEELGEVPAGVP